MESIYRKGNLIDWAAERAETFLSPLGNRWLHVQGVVVMAYQVGKTFNENDCTYLIAAAYLHDIGYAPLLKQTGFHPLDGAYYILSSLGDKRLASLIAHHSGAYLEAHLQGFSRELSAFPREQSAIANALTYCDQIVGPTGQRVTLQERTNEIIQRYGDSHIVTQSHLQSLPHIVVAVAETQERLQKYGLMKKIDQ